MNGRMEQNAGMDAAIAFEHGYRAHVERMQQVIARDQEVIIDLKAKLARTEAALEAILRNGQDVVGL